MKVFKSGRDYENIQIQASRKKIHYCKFSYADAEKYVSIIKDHKSKTNENSGIGPALCLGVRNGREVDCFRIALSGPRLLQMAMKYLEIREFGVQNRFPMTERSNRSRIQDGVAETSCLGVEINPDVRRPDVLNHSFDSLPKEWEGKFGIVYSNAFDHGREPRKVARTWWRMVRPGGYLILCYPNGQQPEKAGPIGDVALDDARVLFPGELVFYQNLGSVWTYTEYIFKKPAQCGRKRSKTPSR